MEVVETSLIDIDNLSLEDLVNLNEKTYKRLSEEFEYYEILSCANSWNKASKQEDGWTSYTPYTSLYKDPIELYKEVKMAISQQVEHIKEFPQLEAYIGMNMDRETGNYTDHSSRLISKKLQCTD